MGKGIVSERRPRGCRPSVDNVGAGGTNKTGLSGKPPDCVVLISSFPYAINWSNDNVPAILHMALNSQEEGNALADVLFGEYNPAGRLVQTWPRSSDQLPPMMDYDIRHGRTYMYFTGVPLYPFGYGLSYTTFAYSNLRVSSTSLSAMGSMNVSVDIKNTGTTAGEEVVQMYIKHLNSQISRPLRELKGFGRISLEPGQNKTVTLPLNAERIAYWNSSKHRFDVEGDMIQVSVGSSSANLKLSKTIRVG